MCEVEKIENKSFFSYALLKCAIRFSKAAEKLEEEYLTFKDRKDELCIRGNCLNENELVEYCNLFERAEELDDQHRSYVISSLINIVTYLEARINEFVDDIADNTDNSIKDQCVLSRLQDYRDEIFDINNNKKNRDSILKKYDNVLEKVTGMKLEKGKSPCQDIDILIQLRNSIIHFKPESLAEFKNGKWEMHSNKISKQIGKKFQLNPFHVERFDYFPNEFLSYSCTDWAIKSALKFLRDFFKKIKVKDEVTPRVLRNMKRIYGKV